VEEKRSVAEVCSLAEEADDDVEAAVVAVGKSGVCFDGGRAESAVAVVVVVAQEVVVVEWVGDSAVIWEVVAVLESAVVAVAVVVCTVLATPIFQVALCTGKRLAIPFRD